MRKKNDWKFVDDVFTPDLANFPLTPQSMEVLLESQSTSSFKDIDDYNIARLFVNSINPIGIVEMSAGSEVSSMVSEEFLDSVTEV